MYGLVFADDMEFSAGEQKAKVRFAELMLREGAPPAASRWMPFGSELQGTPVGYGSSMPFMWCTSPDGAYLGYAPQYYG